MVSLRVVDWQAGCPSRLVQGITQRFRHEQQRVWLVACEGRAAPPGAAAGSELCQSHMNSVCDLTAPLLVMSSKLSLTAGVVQNCGGVHDRTGPGQVGGARQAAAAGS